MKLTKESLKQIIKEELQLVLNEATHEGDSEMIADMKEVGYLLEEYDSLHNEYNSMAEEQHEIANKIREISKKYYILAAEPVGRKNINLIKQGVAFSMYDVPRIIAHLRYYPTDPRLGFGGHQNPIRQEYFQPANLPMPGVRLTNRTK